MKSEHVDLIKKLLQQEITSCDEGMFNETGAVDDWNFGRWYLASQLLTTIKILEQKEQREQKKEENTGAHAEEPMEKFNPIAAAKAIKNYCSGVACPDCVFDSDYGCNLNDVDYIPAEWDIPEEKSL